MLPPAKRAKFVLHKTGPHLLFELVNAQKEILLHSELHRWRGAAEDSLAAVKACAPDDSRYQRRKANGQHYFMLTAPSGEVLATSAMHTSALAMEKAIDAVKRDAGNALVEK